jgi:hypothetical protein
MFINATEKLGDVLGWFYPGVVFGVAIAAVLVLHDGMRSPLKLLGFVAASAAAYPLSIWAGMVSSVVLTNGKLDSRETTGGIPIAGFFVAGCLGALVIFLAASAVFGGANETRRSIGRPLFWSLIGGALGVVGILASDTLQTARTQSNDDAIQDNVLSAIWQTGVALCTAFVLRADNRSAAGKSASTLPPPEHR